MTDHAREFVAPLTFQTLSNRPVGTGLFELDRESRIGHIAMAERAELVLVAPCTANALAKLRAGIADDLATTALMATDKPILVAPAMNVRMWENPATRENLATLEKRGIGFIGPEEGDMACGEWGLGRMSEPDQIAAAVEDFFRQGLPLSGKRALVTSGPTHEAIDPVRYLANRSSGKQGHAIAGALARLGSQTTLVSGPSHQPDPSGVEVVKVESARQMLEACEQALPVDIAVLAAAVTDWRAQTVAKEKIKKTGPKKAPELTLVENPDILATLSAKGNLRPHLVVGFAAETEDVIANATKKRRAKGCDWMVANDVSPETGTFAGDTNTVHLITEAGVEDWPTLSKTAVAERLAQKVADVLAAAS